MAKKKKSNSNTGFIFGLLVLAALGIFIYMTFYATQETQTSDSKASGRKVQPAVSSDRAQVDSLLGEVDSISQPNSALYFTDLSDLED